MDQTINRRKTHTSAEVKNRYNSKAYDRIAVMVYKGEKEIIKKRADSLGMSLNSYINMLIEKDLSEIQNTKKAGE